MAGMDIQDKGIRVSADQVNAKKDDIKDKQAERERARLKKACADFESLLVYYMFKSMRQSVPSSGFWGKNHGKETFEMMLDQKIAEESASKRGGLGLQKLLLEQMDRVKKYPTIEKNN